MKAISIRQPWAYSIVRLGKDIENRDWRSSYRGEIAIHASKGMTQDEFEDWLAFVSLQMDLNFADQRRPELLAQLHRGGIVGVGRIVDCVTVHVSPWFFGPHGLVLADVRPVPFIPCNGQLGIYDLDPAIETKVREALAA